MLCKMTQIYGHPRINQDFHRSCKAYISEIWVVSADTDIDMRPDSALALPQACWDWRNWSAAFSSLGRRCQSGCWMTTWTPRRCWRRSVTTKWPPSSLTPTLLSPISSSRRSALKHQHILLRAAHTCRMWSFSCIQYSTATLRDSFFSLMYPFGKFRLQSWGACRAYHL